jgi:signal transduction histidine kinase
LNPLSHLEPAQRANLLESVIDSVADGIMMVDQDGQFLINNKRAQEITGVAAAGSDWRSWTDTFGCFLMDGVTPYPPENLPLTRAMRGESTDQEDMILRNPALSAPICISISGRPLSPESGIPGGAVIVFRDITHQKENENQLLQSNEKLQQFAYVAAHDLQEPLRTITSYLDLFSKNCSTNIDERGKKYLASAMRGTERMQVLITDLLTYCRVHTRERQSGRFSLKHAFDQAKELLASSISDSGASIICPELPEVVGDQTQFVQLFQNLLSNSLKYRRAESPVITGSSNFKITG